MTKGEFQVDFLRSVAANQGRIESARFSLQRGPLRFPEPLYSLTLEQHGTRSLQQLAWTPELETYLLFDLRRIGEKVFDAGVGDFARKKQRVTLIVH